MSNTTAVPIESKVYLDISYLPTTPQIEKSGV